MRAEIEKMMKTPMEIVFTPATVLKIAGMIQLATRHPTLPEVHRDTAAMFLSATREYFSGCPVVLEMLRRGDDPRYDYGGEGVSDGIR
jgi:hypothetical protein